MRYCRNLAILASTIALLTGCSSLSQMHDVVHEFDDGANAASKAQLSFLNAVQTADCTDQFYTQAAAWSTGSASNFDLLGICTPRVLTDQQLQTRQALMDAITLYADKLNLVASGDNKSLDTNMESLAKNLNGAATSGGLHLPSSVSGVEAAITAIADMALDRKRFADVKQAASTMAPALESVTTALKAENTLDAQAIVAAGNNVNATLRRIVAKSHEQRGAMSFFDVVEARHIAQTVNPFGRLALTGSANGAISGESLDVVAKLNASLDALLKANQAIANADHESMVAAVKDLVARVNDARDVQSAIKQQ